MAKKRRKSKARSRQIEQESRITKSIFLLFAGALLVLMALVRGSSVWEGGHELLFGLFGTGAYFVGAALCYFAILMSRGQSVGAPALKFTLGLLFLTGTLLVFSHVDVRGLSLSGLVVTCYRNGVNSLLGGGVLGAVFGGALLAACGRPVANIVVVLLTACVSLFIFGVTPADLWQWVENGADHASARGSEVYAESMERRAVRRAERQVERAEREAERAERAEQNRRQGRASAMPGWLGSILGQGNLPGPEEESAAPAMDTPARPGQEYGFEPIPGDDFEVEPISRRRMAADEIRRAVMSKPPIDVDLGPSARPEEPIAPPTVQPPAEPTSAPVLKSEEETAAESAGEEYGLRLEPSAPDDIPSERLTFPVEEGEDLALGFDGPELIEMVDLNAEGPETDGEAVRDPVESIIEPDESVKEPVENVIEAPVPAGQEAPARVSAADAIAFRTQPDEDGWISILVRPVQESEVPPPAENPVEEEIFDGAEISQLAAAAMEKPHNSEQEAASRAEEAEERPAEVVQYHYPPLELLAAQSDPSEEGIQEELQANAQKLVETLDSFGVRTRMLDISRGPSVTRYELQPMAGVKISRITSLADDIALNLAVADVRMEAPIPGKPAVGIEVPNHKKTTVGIRSIFESQNYIHMTSPLTFALGKDIAGVAQVADLCKMPHLLIAGSTGSGKSVCVNSIIISFLYRSSPEEVKLLLIDPKVVELAEYNGIPHLLMPVVTEPKKAAGALSSAVAEMERRYQEFADHNVRDIKSYNRVAAAEGLPHMPYIAIIIDELADLMMVVGKDVEESICRIAQKARAAGMHLIVATQRPSVDVITGLIKANIPSRIAFAVSSGVDSRTILDSYGAEKLLGMGDMLFMPVGAPKPTRVQGTFVQDEEIKSVLDFIKSTGTCQYDEAMIAAMEAHASAEKGGKASSAEEDGSDGSDPALRQAVEVVIDAGQASTSLLQRRCKLGYARAARIMDEMEQRGIIGPYEGAKPRSVLITRQQWLEMSMNQSENG